MIQKEYYVIQNVSSKKFICFEDSDQFHDMHPRTERGCIVEDDDIENAEKFTSQLCADSLMDSGFPRVKEYFQKGCLS